VLYEIQMEDSDLSRENDTERRPADHMPPSIFDPNVLAGRVLLTHGPGMDQPLSVIRMNYMQEEVLHWPDFAVIPIWNTQGRAPYVMFSDGQRTLAHPAHPHIKLGTWWLLAKEAYGPANNAEVTSPTGYDQLWLGSVMEDQQDASGLLYRRNRYYDPAAGRFTQEDPIGLAGGLNLYGFAAGDPVSYSDPYGLCPDELFKRRGFFGLGGRSCPGGLSKGQWSRVEESFPHLTSVAASGLRSMLYGGRIRTGTILPAKPGEPAALAHVPIRRRRSPNIVLREDSDGSVPLLNQAPGDRAWALAHEHGHVVDEEAAIATGQQGERWNSMKSQQHLPHGQRTHERSANRYACANSTGELNVWAATCSQ
jgi:RHS repeat-associated protein